jgi:serine/threonine protein kinase
LDAGACDAGPFLAMEYLEGPTLAAHLQRSGPMAPADALSLVLPIVCALAHAHAAGIVHRDVKPANILLPRDRFGDPCPKIGDFGIGKWLVERNSRSLTKDGMVGSLPYMAPEQVREAATVDVRADQYAIAVVLYEACAGKLPYAAQGAYAMMEAICAGGARPLSELSASSPKAFAEVVRRAMSVRSDDRYSTMSELGRELLAFAAGRTWTEVARELRESGHVGDGTRTLDDEDLGPAPSSSSIVSAGRARRGSWMQIAVPIACLTAGGLGTALGTPMLRHAQATSLTCPPVSSPAPHRSSTRPRPRSLLKARPLTPSTPGRPLSPPALQRTRRRARDRHVSARRRTRRRRQLPVNKGAALSLARINLRSSSSARLVCLVAATALLVATRARADEEGAEPLVRQGLELRREHRDAEALAVFRRAYDRVPTPRVKAQVALAEQALGQWLAAETDLRTALDTSGDAWIAHNREALVQALDFVSRHLAWLSVASNVQGARVFIDGASVGAVPMPSPARVTLGEMHVRVEAEGYVTSERVVNVRSNEATTELVVLQAEPRPPSVSPPAASPPAAPPAALHAATLRPRTSTVPWSAIALGIAGVAGVAVGAGYGIDVLTNKAARDQHCSDGRCDPQGLAFDSRARDNATVSTIAFGAGAAALLAAGGLTWVSIARSQTIGLATGTTTAGGGLTVTAAGRW